MKTWQLILNIIFILIVCVALILALVSWGEMDAEKNHSVFDKPGVCPSCGTPLVKGVYGQYFPVFIWYCPNCP